MSDLLKAFHAYERDVADGEPGVCDLEDFSAGWDARGAHLTTAQAEIEALRGRVAELEHLIRYAQVESGVCMCGDEIESHNQASGHSPVDIWDHAVEKALEDTSEAWLKRKQAEAVSQYADALAMWLNDLPGKPCKSFVEGVRSAAEQADRQAQRLRAEADQQEKEND